MSNHRLVYYAFRTVQWARCRQVTSVARVGASFARLNIPIVTKKLSSKVLQLHITLLSFGTFLHLMATEAVEAKAAKEVKTSNETKEDFSLLLVEADDLFNQSKFSEIVELLQTHQETDNVEILWRLSRAVYNMVKEDKSAKGNDLLRKSFGYVKRALELNDKHFAVHKWYALLLDETAALDGIKARINVSMSFKNHMLKATELNPQDATSLYILGSWCFAIAELPWYQRKIAAALFASPPTSTYEEALVYFVQAEKVEPNFYSRNLLMLGKTYLRLKDNENARLYLRKAVFRPARSDEDQQACNEAEELLKQTKA